MAAVALSGKDIIQINDEVVTDLADSDCVQIEFPESIGVMKLSKDGNAVYAFKYTGLQVRVTIRVVRGSYDDQILNGLMQQFIQAPDLFTLMTAFFVKRIGDGAGNIVSEVYQLAGGIFEKIPGATMNTEGDTNQSVSVYTMLFRNNSRLMQ
jgi:hypothetical protein